MANPSSSLDIKASLTLIGATLLALVFANSTLAPLYKGLLETEIALRAGPYALSDTLKVWIKNALMAVFFLSVGLEIKAEFREGALAEVRRAILPFVAAVGGMVVPAAVYLAAAGGDPTFARGWAVPSATDIAFAVGVVGLLGKRVPAALKAFLLAVAVIDDLGAILIIALFYTEGLSLMPLAVAGVILLAMLYLNLRGTGRIWPFMVLMVGLWLAVLQSGINPTLAGVITAMFVPLKQQGTAYSPLHTLVKQLQMAVLFFIMPVFAFANAGVPLYNLTFADFAHPVTLGVLLGLFIAKPLGITLSVFAATRTGLARLPYGVSTLQVVGIGCLAGIGFTMSLFIGVLAFGEGELMDKVRVGVLTGSLLSTIAGATLLTLAARREREPQPGEELIEPNA